MSTLSMVPTHRAGRHTPARRERERRTDVIVSHLRSADPQSSDSRDLVRQLIESNTRVALILAGRFANRGIELDDLQQVALLGLTKAAQRFDPAAGHDFLAFAVPTVRGELRRHFRDAGWAVRPPRRVQELQSRLSQAHGELEQRLGRSPRPSEVAEHLDEEPDDVVEALAADGCFAPTSLDRLRGDHDAPTLGDMIGQEDSAVQAVEAKVVLEPLVRRLSARDRRILRLRFYEERTQQEIGEAVGLTQTQVSRILTRILADLRSGLTDPLTLAG